MHPLQRRMRLDIYIQYVDSFFVKQGPNVNTQSVTNEDNNDLSGVIEILAAVTGMATIFEVALPTAEPPPPPPRPDKRGALGTTAASRHVRPLQ